MILSIDLPTVGFRFVPNESKAPMGYISWSLGGVVPFAHDYPEFLYMLTFLFPEMLAILNRSTEVSLGDSRLNQFVKNHASQATRMSSYSFFDPFTFQVLRSDRGPVIGWLNEAFPNHDETWTGVICRQCDLMTADEKIREYFELLCRI